MKKYSDYKDSGIEWLGKIPAHWNKKRLKYYGYLYGGLSGKSGSDFNNEKNTNNRKFIPFINIANNSKVDVSNLQLVHFEENETQNMVHKGDIFFLMSSENFDDVGKSAVLEDELSDVYLNSFCRGIRITNNDVDSNYLNYLLASKPLRSKLIVGANGFTRINLKTDKIKGLYVLDLPLTEQTAIAKFLDHKTQLIDNLSEKKERLIELLQEERTAVINQAVTKGLDPNVQMKDSDIEWLGEIPEHWEVKKLKYLTDSVQTGSTPPSTNPKYFVEPDLDWFTPVDFVNDIYLNSSKRKISTLAVEDNVVKIFKPFTVLVIGIGATLGKVGIIKSTASSNQQINALEFADDNSPIYYAYYLQSIKSIIRNMSYSATLAILNQNNTRNILMLCPPKSEQSKIGVYIEKMNQTFNNKIELMTEEIKYLVEYKTSLINEAVTGKIDVRDYKLNHATN